MDATHASPESVDLSRRRLLQALAAAGITGPLATQLAAQSGPRVTAETLRQAAALVGHELPPDRLAIVERALQRNLDQFQIVRDLVIDDLVEPAPVFMARTHAGPVSRGK
ncbi:MAG: AtzG-like protein [Vicinamibacterales bacterium]